MQLTLGILLVTALVHVLPASAAETSDVVRFVRVNAIEEERSTPPRLRLTYDLACNQTFLKVVRHEEKSENKKKTLVYLGVLVREDVLKACLTPPVKAKASSELSGAVASYLASRIEL